MIFLQQVQRFVRGESIENPHGAITMFAMCSRMKWAHLPVPGGLYDQDPELLRCWRIIWHEQEKHEREQRAREKREQEARQRANSARPRGASRTRR